MLELAMRRGSVPVLAVLRQMARETVHALSRADLDGMPRQWVRRRTLLLVRLQGHINGLTLAARCDPDGLRSAAPAEVLAETPVGWPAWIPPPFTEGPRSSPH